MLLHQVAEALPCLLFYPEGKAGGGIHVPQGSICMQWHKTLLHAGALVHVQTAARRAASLCVLALKMSAALLQAERKQRASLPPAAHYPDREGSMLRDLIEEVRGQSYTTPFRHAVLMSAEPGLRHADRIRAAPLPLRAGSSVKRCQEPLHRNLLWWSCCSSVLSESLDDLQAEGFVVWVQG